MVSKGFVHPKIITSGNNIGFFQTMDLMVFNSVGFAARNLENDRFVGQLTFINLDKPVALIQNLLKTGNLIIIVLKPEEIGSYRDKIEKLNLNTVQARVMIISEKDLDDIAYPVMEFHIPKTLDDYQHLVNSIVTTEDILEMSNI